MSSSSNESQQYAEAPALQCGSDLLTAVAKAKPQMRAEYKRSDFVKLERGEFFKEASKGTSVALRGLLALADETARITGRSKQSTRKQATI